MLKEAEEEISRRIKVESGNFEKFWNLKIVEKVR